MAEIISCTALVKGVAEGEILASRETISFWGGVDTETGKVVDPRHELFGKSIKDKVLVFPFGKGSAAAPLVLLELAKQQTGPAAIVNIEIDPLLVAGPIISNHFYMSLTPVVLVAKMVFPALKSGVWCTVDAQKGSIILSPN